MMKVERKKFFDVKQAVEELALEVEDNKARFLLHLASTLIKEALDWEELSRRD